VVLHGAGAGTLSVFAKSTTGDRRFRLEAVDVRARATLPLGLRRRRLRRRERVTSSSTLTLSLTGGRWQETSTVACVKTAVEQAMQIPVAEQTLVVNGMILKCETSGLVQYMRPNTLEVCVMVLDRRPSVPVPPVGPDLYD
jgi:hypothetical protein